MIRHALLFLALIGAPASAAEIKTCEGHIANARNLVFPIEEATASYASGAVRLIALDTGGEPACCSAHLMVLYEVTDEYGGACALISDNGSLGFAAMSVRDTEARYDPATGLALSVPVTVTRDGESYVEERLEFVVNRATGEVSLR